MPAPQRPMSVTITCWCLIGLNVYGLIMTPLVAAAGALLKDFPATGTSATVVMLALLHMSVPMLIAGATMLLGLNWGRVLYWVGQPFLLAVALLRFTAMPPPTAAVQASDLPWWLGFIPAVIVYVAVVYVLTRPAANAYFKPTTDSHQQP